MKIKPLKLITHTCFIGFVISFLYAGVLLLQHYQDHKKMRSSLLSAARTQTVDTAHHISLLAKKIQENTHKLAMLTKTPVDVKQIISALKEKPSIITGIGIATTEESTLGKNYSPYYVDIANNQELVNLVNLYDYKQSAWFKKAITMSSEGFIGPFFDPVTLSLSMFFVKPLFQETSLRTTGVVFATMSTHHLNHILTTLNLEESGYWFLLAEDSTIISHPHKSFLNVRTTMYTVAQQLNDDSLFSSIQQALLKEAITTTYTSEITKKSSWLLCEPVPLTEWVLCGTFDKNALTLDNDNRRQSFINIAMMLLIGIFFLVLFLFLRTEKNKQTLWAYTIAISLLLSFFLYVVWNIVVLYPSHQKYINPISSKINLHTILDHIERNLYQRKHPEKTIEDQSGEKDLLYHLNYDYKNSIFIPTGIYINHLEFTKEHQIHFTGYLWQRYYSAIHDNVTRGFILPQAVGIQSIKKICQVQNQEEETVVWHVDAILNQQLSLQHYPFDVKDIQIQLWHSDFEKNIILLPDIDAYTLTSPSARPGLDQDITLSGWTIQESYFGYKQQFYTTNFGLYVRGPFGIFQQTEKSNIPELFFNITTKRHLAGTLVTELVPIAIILTLLFVIFLTSIHQGFGVFGSYAAIFFSTAAFARARFHTKVLSDTPVYFEYFYFIIYIMLVIVTFITILNLFDVKAHYIRHQDNLFPKLLFWPIIFIMILLISIYHLY